jgi:hypothetical protein
MSALMEFFDRWGNAASVTSLVITIIGFTATIISVFKIRKATREAVSKIGLQLLVVETAVLLRLITEARDASREGLWQRAIDRCQQARLIAVPLAHNPHLRAPEPANLRRVASDLEIVVRYIERERLPAGSPPSNLPEPKRRALDGMVALVGDIQGRLQGASMEV